MSKVKDIKKEIEDLVEDFKKLEKALKPKKEGKEPSDFLYFVYNYDLWYTKALHIVKKILPDREKDFISLYKNEKRKEIAYANYTIADALKVVTLNGRLPLTCALPNLIQQGGILNACLQKFESKVYEIQAILQADVFDSELDSAKHLLKKGFLRASGAICGVLIEKHLSKVCDSHGIKIFKKDPSISTYNDALKDNVYDTIEWRRMQRLGDLRNLCDHNKTKEPTKEEVDELILGTDRVIKTIF